MVTMTELNALIARLTHMTNGRVGRDFHSGRRFSLSYKGDEFAALEDALVMLRIMRKVFNAD